MHFALLVGLLYFRMQATMDQIAECSSIAPSLTMDAYSRETSSAYSSPVSATAPQAALSQPIGLGIMNCGLDPTFDHTAGYQRPMPYPMSPLSHSPNSLLQTTAFHGSPFQPQDTSNKVCFSAYNGFQDWGGTQEMSASPSYGSNLEIQSGQEVFYQMPGYWAPMPCPGPTTPLEALSVNATVPARPYMFINNSSESAGIARTACNEIKVASGNRFVCPKCGNTFTRKSNLRQHEKQHDPESRKISRVSCSECSKTFGRKGDLRRHFNNVRKIGPAALTNAYPNSETSSYSRTSL